ncbi:MAG: hypothetical protein ACLR0N_18160 [Bilophila wadsworthia]
MSVNRPSMAAVGHPLEAAQPWATSCRMIPSISGTNATDKRFMETARSMSSMYYRTVRRRKRFLPSFTT